MRDRKKCPKCGGEEILFVEGVASYADAANFANYIPAGFLHRIAVHRYVCAACGFTEEWIDKEDLAQLKKKYPNANHVYRQY